MLLCIPYRGVETIVVDVPTFVGGTHWGHPYPPYLDLSTMVKKCINWASCHGQRTRNEIVTDHYFVQFWGIKFIGEVMRTMHSI